MLTPAVKTLATGTAHPMDPAYGDGQTITLSQELLAHEQDVYANDPTGGAALGNW